MLNPVLTASVDSVVERIWPGHLGSISNKEANSVSAQRGRQGGRCPPARARAIASSRAMPTTLDNNVSHASREPPTNWFSAWSVPAPGANWPPRTVCAEHQQALVVFG